MADNANDKAVLESIFNPYLPLGTATEDDINEQSFKEDDNDDSNVKRAKQLELDGVEKAESGDYDGAMECFNKAIETVPGRASGYNNRAQLWRLKGDVKKALSDLTKAIQLEDHGPAIAQAHTQRGMIHKLQGNDDAALQDFHAGARHGNKFAKSMAIQCNPYAAMCNKMLSEAIGKLSEYKAE